MLKKLSVSKNQLITLLIVGVVVIAKVFAVLFRRGDPGIPGLLICLAMCVFFVLMYFANFPDTREKLFTGNSIIRIVGALIIVLWSFTYDYFDYDYVRTIAILPVMIYCASDVRLMPVNAVLGLATAFRYITAGVVAVPLAMVVSIILVAPHLKGAQLWKKLVFAAVELCLTADIIYIIVNMRYMFTLTSVTANLAVNILLISFAVFFAVCAAASLKKQKKSGKKNKKQAYAAASGKPDYVSAAGYLLSFAFLLLFITLDTRYSMTGLVGVLMALLVLCNDGTKVEYFSDMAAKKLGGIFGKVTEKNE